MKTALCPTLVAVLLLLGGGTPGHAAAASLVRFSTNAYTATEGNRHMTVMLVRTNFVDAVAGVTLTTSNMTAIAGSDYTGLATNIVFGIGEMYRSLVIPIVMDGLFEGTERFRAVIGDPIDGTRLGDRFAVVNILNTGCFEFEWDRYWAQEDEGAVQVRVLRNDSLETAAALDVYTVDGTASAGLDYVGVSNRLHFAAGERLRFVTVPILEDPLREGPENFTVKLANPTEGFALGTNVTTTVKVLDDNPSIHFESDTAWVRENAGSVAVRVKRGGGGGRGAFTVDYATRAVTATPGEDYVETRGTLAFARGETARWLAVPILADLLPEADEEFLLELSQAQGGAALGPATNTVERVTIHDTSGETPHSLDQPKVGFNGALSISLRGQAHARFNDYFNLFPLEQSSDLGSWSALGMLVRTNLSAVPTAYVGSIPPGAASGFFRTPTRQFLTPSAPPTGPHAVGRMDRWLIDPTRRNRFGVSTNSAFQVSIWYPALRKAGAWPLPWYDEAVLRDTNFITIKWMDRVPYLSEYAAAGLELVPEPARLPVVLLSPGAAGVRQDLWEKADEFASHGYVVVSPDHTDAAGVVLSDGRYCRRMEYDVSISEPTARRHRVLDLVFLADQLERWSLEDPLWRNRLDLDRIGVVGFSLGGRAASSFCRADRRCRAAVVLDVSTEFQDEVAELGLQKPSLCIFSSGWYDPLLFESNLRDALYFTISGATHLDVGGLGYWPYGTSSALRRAREVNHTVNAFTVWFLDKYLRDRSDPMPRLLDHPRIGDFHQR